MFVSRTDEFASKTKALSQLLFGLIGASAKEEVIDKISSAQLAMTWNWRFPNDTPVEHRQKLLDEQRRDILLNIWPATPSSSIDGKRPAEVASNPSYRVRVLAEILRMEYGSPQDVRELNLNDLRHKLGLPTRESLDPAQIDVERLSVLRFPQLVVEKLTDDQLVTVFRRDRPHELPRLMLPLVSEVVRRPQIGEKIDLSEAHIILASLTQDSTQAFAYAAKARELAVCQGAVGRAVDARRAVAAPHAFRSRRIAADFAADSNSLPARRQRNAGLNAASHPARNPHARGAPGRERRAGRWARRTGRSRRTRSRKQTLDARERRRAGRGRGKIETVAARDGIDGIDAAHMARALDLAGRGQGFVEPNPMVGCVIVRRWRDRRRRVSRALRRPARRGRSAGRGRRAARGATLT